MNGDEKIMEINLADLELIYSFVKANSDIDSFKLIKHSETSTAYSIDVEWESSWQTANDRQRVNIIKGIGE